MRLRLLDDQASIACFRVLGQLTEHDGHEDQVVEAKPVLLNLERVHHQRQARRQPLKVATAQAKIQNLGKLRPKHRAVPVLDGCVSVDDRLVLLQLLVELLQRVVDAITSRVVSQELKQPGQLAGATGLESLRSVPQRWQIDTAQVLHHVCGQAHVLVVATPALGTQPSRLVGFRVADGDMRFELAECVGLQRCQEVGLVIRVQITKDVLELDVARRSTALGPVHILAVEARVRLIMPRKQRTQCIDDSGLADVVRADQNVQSWLEAQINFL